MQPRNSRKLCQAMSNDKVVGLASKTPPLAEQWQNHPLEEKHWQEILRFFSETCLWAVMSSVLQTTLSKQQAREEKEGGICHKAAGHAGKQVPIAGWRE